MEISTSYVVCCLCALLYNYLVNAQAAHLPTHHVKLCRKLHKCTHLSEKHSRHHDCSNYTRLKKLTRDPRISRRGTCSPIFWRPISAPSMRPRVGRSNTEPSGRAWASQYFGDGPNRVQIAGACQKIDRVGVGANPNGP